MANLTYAMPAFPGYAGYKFGVSPKDLAKKYGFEEDEEGTVTEFGGPYLPTATTTTYKGRGNVLGYRTGGAPTVEQTVFGQAPLAYKPIEPETPETPEPEPEEPEKPEDRFLRSFIGEMGDQDVLGAQALGRAQEYGYSTEDIMQKAQEEGLTFGEQASRSLGVSDLGQYVGELGDPTKQVIGLEALEKARSTMSDDLIKTLAEQQGRSFGEQAAQSLGLPSFSEKADLGQYIGSAGDPTKTVLGLSAVEAARKAGLSDAQIRSQAEQQGRSFASKAAQSVGAAPAPQLSSFIGSAGDPNKQVMGLSAVNQARARGLSDSQIRNLARAQGLSFASGARQSLGI